ncbi:hypothetical protein IGI04_040254 [Brassica rapa subsp. trilocularis]|uniref:Uncharacterized protein n=1 Tax=Brassica rapa subsp. trilocularis TaxID=1813537 RepID=A0ABQ7KRI6_BRACM|nr:hypothetical protein IGI04_040254 [Brassica rapa subsp. trilocularis]
MFNPIDSVCPELPPFFTITTRRNKIQESKLEKLCNLFYNKLSECCFMLKPTILTRSYWPWM